MEEKDGNELKKGAAASVAAEDLVDSEAAKESSKSREEGELSPSDDDDNDGVELPADSSALCTISTAAPISPAQIAPVDRNKQAVKAGNSDKRSNSAGSMNVPPRTSVPLNQQHGSEKSRGPFVPFVISFSDDDSGSDFEDCAQGKTLKSTGNTLQFDKIRRPPSQERSQMPQRTTQNDITKVMPGKVSLNRTFVSSITKINGAACRDVGPSLAGQRSRARNVNSLNKRLTGREQGCSHNIDLHTSKLQDLRQQIAMRQNELRLKSSQKSKERASGSSRDCNAKNLINDRACSPGETATEHLQFEPKEPDRKRQKVSEHCSTLPNRDDQQYFSKQAMLESANSMLENCDQHTLSNCGRHVTQGKNQVGCQDPVFFNEKGTGVVTTYSHHVQPTKPANPSTGIANKSAKTLPWQSRIMKLKHPGGVNSHRTQSSIPNKVTTGKNTMIDDDSHEVGSHDKVIKITSESTYQASHRRALENLEAFDASLDNWNCLDKTNIPENRNMGIESLLEIEELHDKELEEAQEHRRKCEVEERNALKAYRKAQRALIEANARCSHLYQKRELCSVHVQSLMLKDSSCLWSSRGQNSIGSGLTSLHNISEFNMHLSPTSTHQMEATFDAYNKNGSTLHVHAADGFLQNLSGRHEDGQSLASDPCSEHDTSASELQKDNHVEKAVLSPSEDFNISANEDDDTFSFDHKNAQSDPDCRLKMDIFEERGLHRNVRRKSKSSLDSPEDSKLLEASLRSELFARLGMKNLLEKGGSSQRMDRSIEVRTQCGDGRDKSEILVGNVPIIEAEKDQHSNHGERSTDLPVDTDDCCVEKFCSTYASLPATEPPESTIFIEGHQSISSDVFSSPVLRSAFGHMKSADITNLVQSRTGSKLIHTSGTCIENVKAIGSNKNEQFTINSKPVGETMMDGSVTKFGSPTVSITVDPLWPLCIYELRGNCNDNECSWQHVRDYSCGVANPENSDVKECLARGSTWTGKTCRTTNLSKGLEHLCLSSPTYLVSLDTLKDNLYPHKSLLPRSFGQCWLKTFSVLLVLSRQLPADLPSCEPFLHGNEGRIEVYGMSTKRFLYFHSKKDKLHVDESLELALRNLNQEVDKQKGRIEALKVLAAAIEGNPTSTILWIVYLCVYYSNQKFIGKDDMFHCAVEYTGNSYELWLMYINSRIQLEDRLVAYNTALSALCRHAAASDADAVHISCCLLDLLLQMMNCFCISGKAVEAIEKIYELNILTKESVDSRNLLLSDILTNLTICDKCIFWVCCVYLVIYRKLPDPVVQQLEHPKELLDIEWPFTHLTVEERQQAITLMEKAVDSLAIYIDSESLESENTLKAAHHFAVNHIRCMAVLEGLECSSSLLEKYAKLYPSCLELVLMSARSGAHNSGDKTFVGFEEALSNWLEKVPGVHCLWNQYAECALRDGRLDLVKELMNRWFHLLWNVQFSQDGLFHSMDGQNSHNSQGSASGSGFDTWISNLSQIDVAFGFLNLSLYKLLENDPIEARLAVDRALKAATAEDYKHCVREHFMFLMTNSSKVEDTSIHRILDVLKSYLVDARAFYATEPLSRRFILSIKTPRVQQLVSNLLSPVSPDSSTVNLVLEGLHGPSLLPENFGELKDLVDFVESMMEIMPSNYRLATAVCKLLRRNSSPLNVISSSVSFWATSLLVNALCQSVPVAPEYVWVEAADVLHKLTDVQSISECFHKRALSTYPFSIKLWKSYLELARDTGNESAVISAARERGIILD